MGPAYRGHARVFLKDLEKIRPSAIIDIIYSGETFKLEQTVQKGMKALRQLLRVPNIGADISETCQRCGYMASNDLCVGRFIGVKPAQAYITPESLCSFTRPRGRSRSSCTGEYLWRVREIKLNRAETSSRLISGLARWSPKHSSL